MSARQRPIYGDALDEPEMTTTETAEYLAGDESDEALTALGRQVRSLVDAIVAGRRYEAAKAEARLIEAISNQAARIEKLEAELAAAQKTSESGWALVREYADRGLDVRDLR